MERYLIVIALLFFSAHPIRNEEHYYESLIERLEEDQAALKGLEDEIVNNQYKNTNDPKNVRRLSKDEAIKEMEKKIPNIGYDEFALNEANEDEINKKQGGSYHIVHGDLVMTDEEEEKVFEHKGGDAKLKDNVFRDGLLDESKRWPMPIHYTIDSDLNQFSKQAFRDAVVEIEAKTCIRFKEMQSGQSPANYLRVIDGGGCWSYVGMFRKGRGEQKLSLSEGCYWRTTAMHEIIHALGFYHEQSRPDRDDFVEIIFDNVIDGMEHNFEKQKETNVGYYGVDYDIKSLMHYSKTAFSKDGRSPTIVSKTDPEATFGQGFNDDNPMPVSDATQLNNMYCATTATTTTTKPNPATTKKVTTAQPSTTVETTTGPSTTAEPLIYNISIFENSNPAIEKLCKNGKRRCRRNKKRSQYILEITLDEVRERLGNVSFEAVEDLNYCLRLNFAKSKLTLFIREDDVPRRIKYKPRIKNVAEDIPPFTEYLELKFTGNRKLVMEDLELTTGECTFDEKRKDTRVKDSDDDFDVFNDIDDEMEDEQEDKTKSGDKIIGMVKAIQNDLENLEQKLNN